MTDVVKGLRSDDWTKIMNASAIPGLVEFQAAVDAVVLARMAAAFERGVTAGWAAGVADATSDDPPKPRRPRNPYVMSTDG